jgi:2-keto-4-pentenoate hydratase/2-oxohepta-3-ene-1,7-dioic acid hydratase in catechol pathway
MRIVRYIDPSGEIRFGSQVGSQTFCADGEFPNFRPTEVLAEVDRILAPLLPRQIIGIGQNYARHAAESNSPIPQFPVIFYKNVASLLDPEGTIRLPEILETQKPDFEGELAVVIGQDCRDAPADRALEFVAGYTCANDVSARDWQREWGGSQWCRAKSFDTFCPLGPVLVSPEEIEDPNCLDIKTHLNGELVQDANTSDMIFSVRELIAFLSSDTTIPAGTVILTGTPHGVGMGRTPPLWLKPGDRVTVEIEKIGSLANRVE